MYNMIEIIKWKLIDRRLNTKVIQKEIDTFINNDSLLASRSAKTFLFLCSKTLKPSKQLNNFI